MKFTKKLNSVLLVSFFGLLILIVFKYSFINPYHLKETHFYTIARVKNIEGAVNGGPDAYFHYDVKGVQYDGFVDIGNIESDVKVNDRYFIMINSNDYLNAAILLNNPVPDSIKSAPPNGWSTEPWLKKTVVEGVVQSLGKNDWVKVCIKVGDLELCDGGVNKDFNESDVGKRAYVRYSTVDSSLPWEIFKERPTE